MKKQHLWKRLASDMGISLKLARVVVNEFFNSIEEALRRGEPVTLRGLGKFRPEVVTLHRRRNPRTGTYLPSAKIRKIRFRPSLELNNIE